MNFTPLSTMLNDVALAVPGCNQVTMLDALRESARRFCVESLVSQETIETSVSAGSNAVPIESISSDVDPVMVMWMQWGSHGEIWPMTLVEAAVKRPGWRTETSVFPTFFVQELPEEVVVSPIPNRTESSVFLRVAFAPSPATDRVDREVASQFRRAIVLGARAYLLEVPNQPWSNPQAAALAESQFTYEINVARAKAERNNTRANLPRFVRKMA